MFQQQLAGAVCTITNVTLVLFVMRALMFLQAIAGREALTALQTTIGTNTIVLYNNVHLQAFLDAVLSGTLIAHVRLLPSVTIHVALEPTFLYTFTTLLTYRILFRIS